MSDQNLFYQQLENTGPLCPKSEPKKTIIIKYSGVSLSRELRDKIRAEIEQAGDIKAILLPPGFELADELGKWIEKEDDGYQGGGYTACSHFSQSKQTNADRIRAMTDEELAEWVSDMHNTLTCPNGGAISCNPSCTRCWLDWLKKEVEE